ncbi:hypothetical protein Tco_0195697 [Tanacetum coccineum]
MRAVGEDEVQEGKQVLKLNYYSRSDSTEVIQDQESSEKGSAEVSTDGATKGTASEVPVVSTAKENISTAGRTVTYTRRCEEKRTRKDKGKAIMTESEPKKKSKKELEQERISFADTQKEMKEVGKESGAKRKKSLPRKRRTVKNNTLEVDVEEGRTQRTYTLTENFMYYQIFRGDGGSKNYKVFSEMIEDFDRQDVEELYRLVKERYSASRPEGYDLMLWGDLHNFNLSTGGMMKYGRIRLMNINVLSLEFI